MSTKKVLLICVATLAFSKLMYNWITSVDVATLEKNGGIEIIGHGGYGFTYLFPFQYLPTNSKAAINKAIEVGADGVELDVQLTKDSVLVLYHDNELQSMTNKTGCVGNTLWEDLKNTPYSLGFPFDIFQNEKIITLEEAIDELLKKEEFPILHLDFHAYNYCEKNYPINQFCNALNSLLRQKKVPLDKVFLLAINKAVLVKMKEYKYCPTLIYEETLDFEKGIKTAKEMGLTHIEAKSAILTKKNIQLANDSGLFVITHGGKDRWGISNMIEMQPDAIQTDGVDIMIDLLR